MGIRYYKLFDLLNRRNMKKSDLRSVISSATVAKLSKGEYISGEAIEKICLFLECQPGDIMEIVTEEIIDNSQSIIHKKEIIDILPDAESYEERYGETKPDNLSKAKADELLLTNRQFIDTDYPL